jgi:PAS domain S-box-containing protein
MKPGEPNSVNKECERIIRVLEDSESRSRFEQFAAMSAAIFQAPIGFVSLLDSQRCRYIATVGMTSHDLALNEFPHLGEEHSDSPLVIQDVRADARFRDRAIANTDREIRFFASSWITHVGKVVGLIGAMDFDVREFTDSQIEQLSKLRPLAESFVDLQLKNRLAEEAAAITTAFYQKNPVMSHSLDPNGVIVQVSDLWCQNFGYRRDEVIGRKSIEFLTSESRNYAVEVALPQLRDTGQCSNLHFQWVTKDGSIRDVALSAILDQDQFGNPITLAVLTDVSDRVEDQLLLERQSAELYNTRERLETAIIGGDVGLWDWNVRDDEVYFSPVWHTQI